MGLAFRLVLLITAYFVVGGIGFAIARALQSAGAKLCITATTDRAVPPAVSARAAQVMPNATWHDIAGYGHLVHEEAADLVAAPILAFLSSVQAAGAA